MSLFKDKRKLVNVFTSTLVAYAAVDNVVDESRRWLYLVDDRLTDSVVIDALGVKCLRNNRS